MCEATETREPQAIDADYRAAQSSTTITRLLSEEPYRRAGFYSLAASTVIFTMDDAAPSWTNVDRPRRRSGATYTVTLAGPWEITNLLITGHITSCSVIRIVGS